VKDLEAKKAHYSMNGPNRRGKFVRTRDFVDFEFRSALWSNEQRRPFHSVPWPPLNAQINIPPLASHGLAASSALFQKTSLTEHHEAENPSQITGQLMRLDTFFTPLA